LAKVFYFLILDIVSGYIVPSSTGGRTKGSFGGNGIPLTYLSVYFGVLLKYTANVENMLHYNFFTLFSGSGHF